MVERDCFLQCLARQTFADCTDFWPYQISLKPHNTFLSGHLEYPYRSQCEVA
jgi:hypothetical protein